jgi:hypothetical protein
MHTSSRINWELSKFGKNGIMGAKIIKFKINKKAIKEKELTPFQKKLLNFPIMTDKEFKEYKKVNKWMGKWKI